jgi:hypothetical protein
MRNALIPIVIGFNILYKLAIVRYKLLSLISINTTVYITTYAVFFYIAKYSSNK